MSICRHDWRYDFQFEDFYCGRCFIRKPNES